MRKSIKVVTFVVMVCWVLIYTVPSYAYGPAKANVQACIYVSEAPEYPFEAKFSLSLMRNMGDGGDFCGKVKHKHLKDCKKTISLTVKEKGMTCTSVGKVVGSLNFVHLDHDWRLQSKIKSAYYEVDREAMNIDFTSWSYGAYATVHGTTVGKVRLCSCKDEESCKKAYKNKKCKHKRREDVKWSAYKTGNIALIFVPDIMEAKHVKANIYGCVYMDRIPSGDKVTFSFKPEKSMVTKAFDDSFSIDKKKGVQCFLLKEHPIIGGKVENDEEQEPDEANIGRWNLSLKYSDSDTGDEKTGNAKMLFIPGIPGKKVDNIIKIFSASGGTTVCLNAGSCVDKLQQWPAFAKIPSFYIIFDVYKLKMMSENINSDEL